MLELVFPAALVLSLGLFAYLAWAVFRPERF